MKQAAEKPATLTRDGDTVQVNGAMTFATVTSVLRDSESMLREAGEAPVIDLSGVEATDSAALALLLEWKRQGAREGRKVRYQGLPERLQQLARISDVQTLLFDE